MNGAPHGAALDGPRACRTHELAALARAANAIFRPSGGDLARQLPLLFAPDNVDNLRVVVAAGEVVAHAGLCVRAASLQGARVSVGALGAVFTRPDHRGRALGTAVVADALARGRTLGVRLALVSGDRGLYQRLGFTSLPHPRRWQSPPDAAPPAPGLAIAPAGIADVDTLAALYDAEPARFIRPHADWRALLGAGVAMDGPAALWIVRRHGQPAAYLAVRHRATRLCVEHAGARDAVLAAVAHVADGIVAPRYDGALAAAAATLGWRESPWPLHAASMWLDPADAARGLPIPWYGLNYV
jgi:GNAT superfamily N-acetyltransferase